MLALPFKTAAIAGTGGQLRTTAADFVVDETPAYLPTGQGSHIMVQVRKQGLTTMQAVNAVAQALGIKARDIGYAGMKDRHAVTTQWLSLPPPVTQADVAALAIANIEVLHAAPHPHKLRTGHLVSNRFQLTVRNADKSAIARANQALAALAEPPGAPNWYGEQRFGSDGDNATAGRALITGERPRAKHAQGQRIDRLLVSAWQSHWFNAWLIDRLADGLYATAIEGDVLRKVGGGLFICDDPATDTQRLRAGEVLVTGPMFGANMKAPPPQSAAGRREQALLAQAGVAVEELAAIAALADGARREHAVALHDTEVAAVVDDDTAYRVTFTLPKGAYATAIMRELMKPAAPLASDAASPPEPDQTTDDDHGDAR